MAFTLSTEDFFMKNVFKLVNDKTTTSSWKSKQIAFFVGMTFFKDIISNMTILLGKVETWAYIQNNFIHILKFLKSMFRSATFYQWYVSQKIRNTSLHSLFSKNNRNLSIKCNNNQDDLYTTHKCILNLQLTEFEWESLFYLPGLSYTKEQVVSYETVSKDENLIVERLVNLSYKQKEKEKEKDFSIILNGSVVTTWKHYKILNEKELERIVFNEDLSGLNINQVDSILDCIMYDEFRNSLNDLLDGKNAILRFDADYTCNIVLRNKTTRLIWICMFTDQSLYTLLYQIYYNHPNKNELISRSNIKSYRIILLLLLFTYDTQLQNVSESQKIPNIHYQGFLFGQKINITLPNYICHILEQYRVTETDIHALFIELHKFPYAENVQKMTTQHLNITGKHVDGTDVIIKKCDETMKKNTTVEKNVYPIQMSIRVHKREREEKENGTELDVNMLCIQRWNELIKDANDIKAAIQEKKKTQIELHHRNKITVPVYTLRCEAKECQNQGQNQNQNQNQGQNQNQSQNQSQNQGKNQNQNQVQNHSSEIEKTSVNQIASVAYDEDQLFIKKTYIKHIKRDFSSIFLPQEHKQQLMNILHNFKNHIHKLQEVGLPNKLGVMLHGIPGSGKTSIINAIATYLEKDIYYINLNSIKSNEELGKMFHYIFKETSKGGIVVMEDIDAMTEIVHARREEEKEQEENKEESQSQSQSQSEPDVLQFKKENNALMINIPNSLKKFVEKSENILEFYTNENKELKDKINNLEQMNEIRKKDRNRDEINQNKKNSLTLEYILNLLQGSLTLDGTIFIATTNHYKKLDQAFVRDGRFDFTLQLSFCVAEQLKDLFHSFFQENVFPPILSKFQSNRFTTSTIFVHLSKYILTYNDQSNFVFTETMKKKYGKYDDLLKGEVMNDKAKANANQDEICKMYHKQLIVLDPFLECQ